MPMTPDELARRLEEGSRARLALRKATRELRKLGEHILEDRRRGSGRSPQQRAPVR